MRVYKGLKPCPRSLISNLDDMGKSREAIGLHKELGFCEVPIVGAAMERPLRGIDRISAGYRRVYVRGTSSIKKNRPGQLPSCYGNTRTYNARRKRS
jgi:hypothetical protein